MRGVSVPVCRREKFAAAHHHEPEAREAVRRIHILPEYAGAHPVGLIIDNAQRPC